LPIQNTRTYGTKLSYWKTNSWLSLLMINLMGTFATTSWVRQNTAKFATTTAITCNKSNR
jgi:hypothetical protein